MLLAPISLSLCKGELLVICAEHKAGKTRLLNLLALFDRPEEGIFEFCGENIDKVDRDILTTLRTLNIGFIEQHIHFNNANNLLELVMQPLLICGFSQTLAKSQAQQALSDVGLSLLLAQSPLKLSLSQLKRTALARAIALNPKLIIGDELITDLDHENASLLLTLLQDIRQKRGTACILSGKPEPIYQSQTNQLWLLKNGQLVRQN